MLERAKLVAADVQTEDSLALNQEVRATPRTAEESAEEFSLIPLQTAADAEAQTGVAALENGDNPQNSHVVRNSADSRTDLDDSTDFSATLDVARRLYDRVRLREIRSDRALRLFLAGAGLLVREAQRHPARFDEECKKARVKGGKKRPEVRAIRLAANDPGLHAPKWANAAAYIALPPNGDPPPLTLRAAERYLRKRGNMRKVSDLYVAHRRPKPEAVDITEWADAQLEGIPCDAEHGAHPQLATDPAAYRIGLMRLDPDGSTRKWLLAEADDFGDPTVRRAVKKIKHRTILEDGPRTYIERSMAARAASAAKALEEEDEPPDAASNSDETDDTGLDSRDRDWLSWSNLLDFVGLRVANVVATDDLDNILRGIREDEHFLGVCLVRKMPGYVPDIFGPTKDHELIRRVVRQIKKESGR